MEATGANQVVRSMPGRSRVPDKVSCIYASQSFMIAALSMSQSPPIDNLAPLVEAGVPILQELWQPRSMAHRRRPLISSPAISDNAAGARVTRVEGALRPRSNCPASGIKPGGTYFGDRLPQ